MSSEEEVKPVEPMEIENAPVKPLSAGEIDRMMKNDERAPKARGTVTDSVPRSYWYSWQFLGTFAAIILAKDAGSGGFSLAAPVLADINREIGPDPDITWVSLSWTLTQGVSTLVVGRMSDVFGRRWIFIVASILGTAGAVWASQTSSVKQLVGATVILGLAGGVQISYFWIISEIVPMRWRFIANAVLYLFSFTSWLGPKISYDFFTKTSIGWHGAYYFLIALNGLSTILFYLCYHPPTFKMLHRRTALFHLIKTFDWTGLTLYMASFTCFLIGLNWGGGNYPWSSSEVLGMMIGGLVGLAIFGAFEVVLPLWSPNITPFVPMHFFTSIRLLAITGMTCVAGSTYYGIASVWPNLVNNVWNENLSQTETGNMLSLFALTYVWAQFVGGLIAHFHGAKRPIIVSMFIAAPLFVCLAIDPLRVTLTSVMISLGGFSLGIMEGVALTATTYPLRSQDEIGSAGGVTGTIRLFVSTIATAVYNTTIRNRLNTTLPSNIGPAAVNAGLPESSVAQLISAFRDGLPLDGIPGLTTAVEKAARLAYRISYSKAYKTLFLVCIAFTVPGCIFSWFVIDPNEEKQGFIATNLHKRTEEKRLKQDEN